MAVLTYPLTMAQFFDLLPIESLTFEPHEAVEIDETIGGEVLKADLGAALWTGQIDLTGMPWEEAIDLEPMVNLLRRPGASFMVSDPRRPWPRKDPQGTILRGSVVQLAALSGTREMALQGLPAGYVLSRGDLLSFSYGTSPTRYALHELTAPIMANAAGVTDLVEVSPPIRPGASIGTEIQLIWPRCKAVLLGGAKTGTSRADLTQDASMSWVQTLR